jgi:hypothetical protein
MFQRSRRNHPVATDRTLELRTVSNEETALRWPFGGDLLARSVGQAFSLTFISVATRAPGILGATNANDPTLQGFSQFAITLGLARRLTVGIRFGPGGRGCHLRGWSLVFLAGLVGFGYPGCDWTWSVGLIRNLVGTGRGRGRR